MEDSKLNYKLQAARDRKVWTLEEAAEAVGVGAQTFWRWENYVQRPRQYALRKLIQVFGASAKELGFGRSPGTFDHAHPAEEMEQDEALPPTSTAAHTFARAAKPTITSMERVPSEQVPGEINGGTTVDMFSIGVVALLLARQQYNWSLDELQFRTEQEMKKLDIMTRQTEQMKGNFSHSRRDVLRFLIRLPLAMFGLTQSESDAALFLPVEEMIPFYVTGVPACWRCFFTGEFAEVKRVLPTYISHVTFLAQQSSNYQRTAASLASQTHQLAAALVLQREDFGTSLDHCKQASLYGQLAGDPNVLAGALIRQVDALFYRKRHTQVVSVIQEAFSYINDVSPLMRSRLYSELGSIEAYGGDEQTALRYMGLARDTFPDSPEDDAGFLFTHTNTYIILLNEALAYMDLNQPKAAWEAIERAEAYVPVKVSSRGLELLNLQTAVATARGDMDLSCHTFQAAIAAGSQLGSSLWLNDARDIYYNAMLRKWSSEKQVKDLEDLLREIATVG
jgi:transcriptional regulator with XRE-family HTH domain/tetratricopeptide (TPR) repeat protein